MARTQYPSDHTNLVLLLFCIIIRDAQYMTPCHAFQAPAAFFAIHQKTRTRRLLPAPLGVGPGMMGLEPLATIITTATTTATTTSTMANFEATTINLASLSSWLTIDSDISEAVAGPFFGASLLPYLAFLYFLNVPENETPKGVTVGFATCLLFVFLTIPAAIAAKLQYGVSLADSDWLHGSAESLLTMTNLVTVIAFRQALAAKENANLPTPQSALTYSPMVWLVLGLTTLAAATAILPALSNPQVHTLYLNGFFDLPDSSFLSQNLGAHPEPENALSVPTWIIHVSSLVEFLVAMGFCWRWGDVVENPRWKGLTWGLLPLHSSGITACTYHLFYNQIPILVPLQALLTCVGNTTAAFAAYRIAVSNGWTWQRVPWLLTTGLVEENSPSDGATVTHMQPTLKESGSLIGFEDLGDALAGDDDYTFLIKLFVGCAVASYLIKYGEVFFDFPYDANVFLGLSIVAVPSVLNAFKWYKRSKDPSFEGWF
mmetsp:Transcript_26825/g.62879  ORF Transcript_26825/g.62879 Transcript_26825/m.62879 type:complete len:487 (-) Transcript_26825:8-1468(-)